MNKKYLFCPRCNGYPHVVITKYYARGAVQELRRWSGANYALVLSDLDALRRMNFCADCERRLEKKTDKR